MINKEEVNNINLFELNDFQKLNINEQVMDFLIKTEYPWLVLGDNLTLFIKNLITLIPLNKRINENINDSTIIVGDDVVIEKGAEIEPQCYISGPTYIAKGAIIRQGAYIRGSVYVGENAVVGHTSEIKGTLMLPKSKAAHFAYVGDSILGVDTNLGAGTKLANLRFDHAKITLKFNDEIIKTELKKFGAILANYAQTGCNSVTNPGTIMLKKAMLAPCVNGSGIIKGIRKNK